MQGQGQPLALDVSAVGASFGAIERSIEARRPIVVIARKPSPDADALARFLRPLLEARDDRSDWQAMRDSWRLRHFATCFGLTNHSGYRWSVEQTDSYISVTFEPKGTPG